MKENIIQLIIAIMILFFLAFNVVEVVKCNKSGGTSVRGLFKMECINENTTK